jgi:hypothetical protein
MAEDHVQNTTIKPLTNLTKAVVQLYTRFLLRVNPEKGTIDSD